MEWIHHELFHKLCSSFRVLLGTLQHKLVVHLHHQSESQLGELFILPHPQHRKCGNVSCRALDHEVHGSPFRPCLVLLVNILLLKERKVPPAPNERNGSTMQLCVFLHILHVLPNFRLGGKPPINQQQGIPLGDVEQLSQGAGPHPIEHSKVDGFGLVPLLSISCLDCWNSSGAGSTAHADSAGTNGFCYVREKLHCNLTVVVATILELADHRLTK
mmetsp:Transcript_4085/g.8768  ORF Transcript_4085/g.8768 Transcript_4085/m.8768 type:complete len:216 (+) Transcript_4085:225-872(+)